MLKWKHLTEKEKTFRVAIAGIVIIIIGCLAMRIDGVIIGSGMAIIGWLARGKMPK